MIVGASREQLDLITRAGELGYRTVVIDGDPNAPGLKQADIPIVISTRATTEVIEAARRHQVRGVVTNASESAVVTVAHVAAAIGSPGLPVAVADRATNKYLMKLAFADAGVPTPDFASATDWAEAGASAEAFGYPVIVKPVDGAGSRGVIRVDDAVDLQAAFDRSVKFSRVGQCLIERFVQGLELSADAFSYRGTPHILGVADKEKVTTGTGNVAMSIAYPARISKEERAIAEGVIARAITAVGITDGPSHTELIRRGPGDFVVLEIGARGGGFWTFSRVIPRVSGVDTLEALINLAVGKPVNLRKRRDGAAVLRFTTGAPGRISALGDLDRVRALPGMLLAGYFSEVGAITKELVSDGDRVGYMIVTAPDLPEALNVSEEAARLLSVTTVPPSSQ